MSVKQAHFGKMLAGVSWYVWLLAGIASAIFIAGLFRVNPDNPIGLVVGALMLAGLAVGFHRRILLIPVVETTEAGLILRPASQGGYLFYKWEDIQEVVIWYQRTNGDKSTMVGILPRVKREPDNYDRYPLVRPNDRRSTGPYPRYVAGLVGKWSVNIGSTKASKIAGLIDAAGKSVPVVENPLWSDEVRALSHPQPE
ncbi:hypothetical protein O1R50_13225 [Glycomyces luteolus]|uniref:Uncharacterized protein n=1 Tax=Glycomyces luteolus TaxID=2670330 RepID=A0A9X3P923_9ACTN|nr:hypothetical protein [Glycomyces luteolus]MDA1360592.1 hypothetical protein [Glycomyces luteolus]